MKHQIDTAEENNRSRPVPSDLVPFLDVLRHRPWTNERYLRGLRARRELPVWRLGTRLLVSLADVDALLLEEPARRGPLAKRDESDSATRRGSGAA